MEQARYWMLMKRKNSSSSYVKPLTNRSFQDSWEEQAFAEDASGPLGGCIWPPRSYSCSFCKREFRSAQALGGHMNVHRRDRAKLKQSPNQNYSPCTSPGVQYTSQVCTLVYNPNANPNPNSQRGLCASSPSPSRVLDPSKITVFPSLPMRSNMITDRPHPRGSDPKSGDKSSLVTESGLGGYVRSDLSASLNLAVYRARPMNSKEENTSHKRQRTNALSSHFTVKSSSVDERGSIGSEVLELSSSSSADLDLELRLGCRPI